MKKTLRKATEEWVAQFSHVPGSVIQKLAEAGGSIYSFNSDSLRLIASPHIICAYCLATYDGDLSVADLTAAFDRGKGVPCKDCGWDGWYLEEPQFGFPFESGICFVAVAPCDLQWFDANKDEVAKLGIFVFESDQYGILLRLDKGAIDFYDAYWIPLYRLRGLRWHE